MSEPPKRLAQPLTNDDVANFIRIVAVLTLDASGLLRGGHVDAAGEKLQELADVVRVIIVRMLGPQVNL